MNFSHRRDVLPMTKTVVSAVAADAEIKLKIGAELLIPLRFFMHFFVVLYLYILLRYVIL